MDMVRPVPAAVSMVERHLKPAGLKDPRVIEAMSIVPRHVFLPQPLGSRAYGLHSVPIGMGQTASSPLTVARAVEALGLSGKEKVLEIGTGSGYQAAVLSLLCDRVFTIERLLPFVRHAKECFSKLGIHNVVVKFGDGGDGWEEFSPFDAAVCAAAMEEVPETLVRQLKVGAPFVAPLKSAGGVERMFLLRRDKYGMRIERDLGECTFVPFLRDFRS